MNKLKEMIKIDKKKAIITPIVMLVFFAFYFALSSWHTGAFLATALAVLGCIKLNTKKHIWEWSLNILWAVSMIYITLVFSIYAVNVKSIIEFGFLSAVLNCVCIVWVCSIFYCLMGKWKFSFSVGCLLLILLTTVNGFVYQFRGKELMPTDFLSFKTALNVIKQYKLTVEPLVIKGWITCFFIFVSQFFLPSVPKFSRKKAHLAGLCVTIVLFSVMWLGTNNLPIKLWANEGTKQGYFINFFIGVRNSFIQKPQNYDTENIEKLAKTHSENKNSGKSDFKPNIIVIMDESFADLRTFGDKLKTDAPVMPFLDSLEENTVKGYGLTSVFGGNTANSEMEFLTGHTMAFLPDGSVPYQQYISKEIYSLPWLLKSYGYKTVATHPFPSDGWSRDKVYPYLGFSESTFLESYPRKDILRYYVSDVEMFQYIIEKVNNAAWQEPYFLFGITMQNHGGYAYKGKKFKNTISLGGYSGEYPLAEQYLSLVNYTDNAVKYLIEELEKIEKETVLLFFGDHLPKIEDEFFKEIGGEGLEELEEQKLKHTVPFYIWANYDIDETEIELTSLNYLSEILLETAGVELDPYNRYLASLREKIPAINAFGYYSKEKGKFIPLEEAEGEEKRLLNQYASVQYNNLRDKKQRSMTFYENFISYNENK